MKTENIKFKAKRLDNGKWVKGYFYKECGNTYIIEDSQRVSMLDSKEAVLIAPDTVCANTALLDMNGNEIYEGDVLRSDEYPFSCIEDNKRDNYFGTIDWSEESASFYIEAIKAPKSSVRGISDGCCDNITQEAMFDFEVVGNIHDHEWQKKLNITATS